MKLITRSALALPLLALLFSVASAGPADAKAPTIKWNKPVQLGKRTSGGITAISCPTATFCAAVDQSGHFIYSTKPTGGAHAWKSFKIDLKAPLTGISCPSTSLCVAVDADGMEMHSKTPLKGKKFWTLPARIDTATAAGGGVAGLAAISCPSKTLCVAVDNGANGDIVSTTTPAGPAKAWKTAALGTNVTLDTVNCSSATLCAVGGSQHYYSTNPTGGTTSWKASGALDASGTSVISGIDCVGTSLCIGVGYGDSSPGMATATATPTTAAAWSNTSVEADPPLIDAGLLDGVSCINKSVCVAVDSNDNVYTTSTPLGTASTTTAPLGASATPKTATAAAVKPITPATTTKPATTPPPPTPTTPATPTTPSTTTTTPATTTTTPKVTVPPAPWSDAVAVNKKSSDTWASIACAGKLCVVVDGSGYEIAGTVR